MRHETTNCWRLCEPSWLKSSTLVHYLRLRCYHVLAGPSLHVFLGYYTRHYLTNNVTTDLQMVNISLRVLTKPDVEQLANIFKVGVILHLLQALPATLQCASLHLVQGLGLDWDERVLPSIGNEIIKAVVAQYNAEQLLTQRDKVSKAVRDLFPKSCKCTVLYTCDHSCAELNRSVPALCG